MNKCECSAQLILSAGDWPWSIQHWIYPECYSTYCFEDSDAEI